MTRFRSAVVLLVLVVLVGCREDPAAPYRQVEVVRTAVFEFDLPPATAVKALEEHEFTIAIDDPVVEVRSVTVSARGEVVESRHVCAPCSGDVAVSAVASPEYTVPKWLDVEVRSGFGLTSYTATVLNAGVFELVRRPLRDKYVGGGANFADGTGVVRFVYGEPFGLEMIYCVERDEVTGELLHCVLDPGAIAFDGKVAVAVEYMTHLREGTP